MTYSIAARCPKTGAFGIAITSSSICVASRCAWVGPLGRGVDAKRHRSGARTGRPRPAAARARRGGRARSAVGWNARAGMAAGRRHRPLRKDRLAFGIAGVAARCLRSGRCVHGSRQSAGFARRARAHGRTPMTRPPARISPNGCCGVWKRGSRPAAKPATSTRPACMSPRFMTGRWSISASTGTTNRLPSCGASGSSMPRSAQPTNCARARQAQRPSF